MIKKSNHRRLDIDAIKVIGAFLVVAYHCEVVPLTGAFDSFPSFYLRSFFAICVPVFFFSTGLLYSRKAFSSGKGLRKALKLLLLTLMWGGGVTWIVVAGEKGLRVTPGIWASGVLTLQQGIINHLWFLPALAIVCLLLPVFSSLQQHDARLFGVLTAGCLVFVFGYDALSRLMDLAGWLIDSRAPSKLAGFVNLFNPIRGIYGHSVAYCLAGMWLSGRDAAFEGRNPRALRALSWAGVLIGPLLLAAYSVARVHLTGDSYDPTWNGYSFAGTLAAVLGLYFILHRALSHADPNAFFGKIASLLGRNSFATYLFHWPIVKIAYGFLPDSSFWLIRVVVGLLACAAIVLPCAFAGELLSKTKAGRWILSA